MPKCLGQKIFHNKIADTCLCSFINCVLQQLKFISFSSSLQRTLAKLTEGKKKKHLVRQNRLFIINKPESQFPMSHSFCKLQIFRHVHLQTVSALIFGECSRRDENRKERIKITGIERLWGRKAFVSAHHLLLHYAHDILDDRFTWTETSL